MSDEFNWKQFFKIYWPFFLVILIFIFALLDFYDLGLFKIKGIFYRHNAEPFVTFIVGLPLVLTLWQAFQANNEAQRQTRLQLRPFLRIQWSAGTKIIKIPNPTNPALPRPHANHFNKIILVNEGNGVAVNVKFAPFIRPSDSDGEMIKFKTVTAMSSKGGQTTLVIMAENYNISNLDPQKQGTKPYEIWIKYSDLEGQQYEQKFESSKEHNDGYQVLEW